LAIAIVLFASSKCGVSEECLLDDDCDDGNPCTRDVCKWVPSQYVEDRPWWCDATNNYCSYNDVEDGTPCQVEEQSGICEIGVCRIEDENPKSAFEPEPGGANSAQEAGAAESVADRR
jgi:hypothetical protein